MPRGRSSLLAIGVVLLVLTVTYPYYQLLAGSTAQAPIPPQPRTGRSDGVVLGNPRSRIYHWPGCPQFPPDGLQAAQRGWVVFSSRAAAEEAHYRPAWNCPRARGPQERR